MMRIYSLWLFNPFQQKWKAVSFSAMKINQKYFRPNLKIFLVKKSFSPQDFLVFSYEISWSHPEMFPSTKHFLGFWARNSDSSWVLSILNFRLAAELELQNFCSVLEAVLKIYFWLFDSRGRAKISTWGLF